MEHKYMVVAFINEQQVGVELEPPKTPHITLKKKFKLNNLDESALIKLLTTDLSTVGTKELETGKSEEYGSKENMIIKVTNSAVWEQMHLRLLELLAHYSESRDPHFEGKNYLPHITWRLKGEDTLNPYELENKIFPIKYIYLIERIHPTKSIARIVAKISLSS